jgi:hypothetical protein
MVLYERDRNSKNRRESCSHIILSSETRENNILTDSGHTNSFIKSVSLPESNNNQSFSKDFNHININNISINENIANVFHDPLHRFNIIMIIIIILIINTITIIIIIIYLKY